MESSSPSNVIDLMEALQKSLESSKNPDEAARSSLRGLHDGDI